LIPAAIARGSVLSDPNAAFRGDPGRSWSPKEGNREIPAGEETATAIPGRYSDELLVATDPTVSAEFVISGYCRRWSVELAFFDSKQHLGLHDPRVWSART